jgi:hypothetical protein
MKPRSLLVWSVLHTATLILVCQSVDAEPRAAAATTSDDTGVPPGASGNASGSPFTIGTLYGLAIPLYAPQFFRVTNGNLEQIRSAKGGDYFVPAVYVLPSVAVWSNSYVVRKPKNTPDVLKKIKSGPPALSPDDYDYSVGGRTLSIILPAGLNVQTMGGTNVSIGLGLSFGWALTTGSEVGIGLATVWSQVPYLSDQQRKYVGAALPAGVSDQIDTRLMPSCVLGAYISPTF